MDVTEGRTVALLHCISLRNFVGDGIIKLAVVPNEQYVARRILGVVCCEGWGVMWVVPVSITVFFTLLV